METILKTILKTFETLRVKLAVSSVFAVTLNLANHPLAPVLHRPSHHTLKKQLHCTFKNIVSCILQSPSMLFLGHCEEAHEKKKKKLSLGFGIGGERHSSVIPSSSHAVNPSLPLSDQSQSWSSAP